MKTHYFLSLFLFFLFFCKKEQKINNQNFQKISERITIKESSNSLELKSGKFQYVFNKNQLPFKKVILLNSSFLGYFTAIDAQKSLVGVTSPEYIYNQEVRDLISSDKIENIGNEQKYDIEKIVSLKPDVIFTNYIESFQNTYDFLEKNGIKIIFLDEYLEQNPLEKTAYVRVFGALLGKESKAKNLYLEIEKNYKNLKMLASKATTKPIVIANEMYGNQWFLPGGKTSLAQFIKDAHAQYILAENTNDKAIPMSFEEVFAKSEHAKFWINVGNHHTKKELLSINPNYTKMNVFKSGTLYTVSEKENGKANDYFENGVVRADWVLKDYIKIFHPELLSKDSLIFMKELK